MTELKYFIIGIIFALLIIPILQVLADIIFTTCEVIKGKMSVIITRSNVEVHKLNMEVQDDNHQLMGFQIPSEEQDIEEEVYDSSIKHKVGFING